MDELPLTFRIALFGSNEDDNKSFLKVSDSIFQTYQEPSTSETLEYYTTTHKNKDRTILLEFFYPVDSPNNVNSTIKYHASLILYDTTDTSSFKSIKKFLDFRNTNQIFIVGIKKNQEPDQTIVRSTNSFDSRVFNHPHFTIKQNSKESHSDFLQQLANELLIDFNKDLMKICKSITKELIAHPASVEFREPVDRELYPDYYSQIKRPQDLSSILKRLEDNKYTSPSKWERDVYKIFKNCEQYNGKDSVFSPYISELEKFFKSQLKKLPKTGLKKTSTMLNSLVKKINVKCDIYPPGLKDLFLDMNTYAEAELKLPFEDQDIGSLISGISALSKTHNSEIYQILKYFNIPINENDKISDINVDDISDEAKMYLRSYVNFINKQKK